MMLLNKKFPARYNSPVSAENTQKSNKGAITVEYAFGMALAAFFMMTVEWLFRNMAIGIIESFKQLVQNFPDI